MNKVGKPLICSHLHDSQPLNGQSRNVKYTNEKLRVVEIIGTFMECHDYR
jgi:hypothetical protein